MLQGQALAAESHSNSQIPSLLGQCFHPRRPAGLGQKQPFNVSIRRRAFSTLVISLFASLLNHCSERAKSKRAKDYASPGCAGSRWRAAHRVGGAVSTQGALIANAGASVLMTSTRTDAPARPVSDDSFMTIFYLTLSCCRASISTLGLPLYWLNFPVAQTVTPYTFGISAIGIFQSTTVIS